jgi:hypothetical protein
MKASRSTAAHGARGSDREFLASYLGDERARRISHRYLPSREAIVEILEAVLDLMYRGIWRRDLSRDNLSAHVAQYRWRGCAQARARDGAPSAGRKREGGAAPVGRVRAAGRHELAQIFLGRLPRIRSMLIRDVRPSTAIPQRPISTK